MKKAIMVFGILLLSSTSVSTVYAGTLNQYESKIVAAAKQTYQYNGVDYRTAPTYISQLIGYLSTDGIDLTADQSKQVIQTAYASIERGVMEGYLIPSKDNQPSGNNTTEESSDSGNAGTEAANNTPSQEEDNTSANDNTSQNDNTSENNNSYIKNETDSNITDSNITDSNITDSKNNNAAQQKDIESFENMAESTPEDIVGEKLKEEQKIDPITNYDNNSDANMAKASDANSLVNSVSDFTNSSNKNVDNNSNIISERNLNLIFLIIAGMAILMMLGIIITKKTNYIAPKR